MSSWMVEYSRPFPRGSRANLNQLAACEKVSCVMELKIKGNLFGLSFFSAIKIPSIGPKQPIYTIARTMIYELFLSKAY